MGEASASATAVLVCQGRACADGRWAVGRFSDPVAHDLLEPAELAIVDAVRGDTVPSDAAARLAWELVRQTALTVVARTVAIDDAIRAHGAGQLVVLGAGLDSRAWRMPELSATTVFEVDRPASQKDKRRRLGALQPVAGRVVEVPLDLGDGNLGRALEEAGFDVRAATTWVWEGVIPYLRAAVVRATLADVAAQSASGSRLILNYQSRALLPRVARAAMRLVLRASKQPDPLAGEPWRSLWRPAELASLCGEFGYRVDSDTDLLAVSEELELPAGNAGSLRNGRVAVATRV
jgi:methyltransferase (TIGR00027 family)